MQGDARGPGALGGVSRLLVIAAALLFSTGGSAIKFSAWTSWQIAGMRSAIAAVVLFLCMPSWRPTLRLREIAVGTAYAATLILFVTANTLTTASNAIFLQATAPLYVLLLGPWLLGEPLRRADFPLVALIGGGLALIFFAAQGPLRTAPDPELGNWVAVGSGVTWALTLLGLRWTAARPARPERPERDATGAAVITGNLIALLACLPWMFPLHGSAAEWGGVVYLGSVQIGLAYACLVRGMRRLRAIEAALLLSAEPVLSALLAWFVHGERPAGLALAGAALIGAALVAQAVRPSFGKVTG